LFIDILKDLFHRYELLREVKGIFYDFVGFVSFLELDIMANCSPCHYPIAMEGMSNGGLFAYI
jgi:hypothetical protein